MSTAEAVRKGCELRLRPLLMTALAMLLGLVPMIYATGSGSEIQRPLAAVVLGGLVSSMFLTLVVLPAIYHIVESRRECREINPQYLPAHQRGNSRSRVRAAKWAL